MEKSEVKEIVEIILKDSHAINNWRSICEALGKNSAEFESISREREIKDLFKGILERWKSENGENAKKANLEIVFRNASFNYIADSVRPLKFPLRLNYEGVVANYVSRLEYEEEIIKYLTDLQSRICSIDFPVVVLHGIGGVGKTTLARRIFQLTTDANKVQSGLNYFEQNCIWIHAEKEELIVKDFSKLLGTEVRQHNPIKEVLIKFYKELNNKPCLIVFDNVDDYEMIVKYLPLNLKSKVSVLITSNIEWDSGDLGKVEHIKIEYFTAEEFSIFVRELIPNISPDEIEYLDEYTGRIPYLANIACRGLAKWRKHRSNEKIEEYFQINENLLEDGFKLGINSQKYKLKPQEIVERQIKLMQKYEEEDGESAYNLLCRLAFCNPDIEKRKLLECGVDSNSTSISILVEHGFLKEYILWNKGLSFHRSYQKAIQNILQKEGKEEEQIEQILEMIKELIYGDFEIWNFSAIWKIALKCGDIFIEQSIQKQSIKNWFKFENTDNNAVKSLVDYLKQKMPQNEFIQMVLFRTDNKISPIIKFQNFYAAIDDDDCSALLEEIKSLIGKHRRKYLRKLAIYVLFKKRRWLESALKNFPQEFKNEEANKPFLVLAAEEEELEAVEYLIEQGINVNVKDKKGRTPLFNAVSSKNLKMAKVILKAGANPNIPEKSMLETPLHLATRSGQEKMVKLLLSYNADPKMRQKKGQTALDLAKMNYENEIIQIIEGTRCAT